MSHDRHRLCSVRGFQMLMLSRHCLFSPRCDPSFPGSDRRETSDDLSSFNDNVPAADGSTAYLADRSVAAPASFSSNCASLLSTSMQQLEVVHVMTLTTTITQWFSTLNLTSPPIAALNSPEHTQLLFQNWLPLHLTLHCCGSDAIGRCQHTIGCRRLCHSSCHPRTPCCRHFWHVQCITRFWTGLHCSTRFPKRRATLLHQKGSFNDPSTHFFKVFHAQETNSCFFLLSPLVAPDATHLDEDSERREDPVREQMPRGGTLLHILKTKHIHRGTGRKQLREVHLISNYQKKNADCVASRVERNLISLVRF
jgi:hypothetical protein